MYWQKCDVEFFSKNDLEWVKLIGRDCITNTPYWVYIPKANYDMLLQGYGINKSLKGIDYSIKNFLANGIAPKVRSVFAFERKIKNKVFITNATANSVAFYAWLYINKCTKDELSHDTLKEMFLKQSEDFLVIYTKLLRNPDELLNKLNKQEYRKYFNDVSKVNIPKQFFRKVYHINLECESMRSPFEEGNMFYANTGVFFERNLIKGTSYYCLDEPYLKELGMRQCKKCEI